MSATGSFNDGDDVLEIVPKPGTFSRLGVHVAEMFRCKQVGSGLGGNSSGEECICSADCLWKSRQSRDQSTVRPATHESQNKEVDIGEVVESSH